MRYLILICSLLLIENAKAENFPVVPDETGIVFKGRFDREAIRRVIKAAKPRIQKCKSDKPLSYSVEFQIGSNGRAKAGMNSGYPLPSDQALDCVFSVINSLRFPDGNNDSSDSVQIPMTVGKSSQAIAEVCNRDDIGKNFEDSCMSLNGLHLRALKVAHLQNSFRVVCKCVRENFDLKKLIQGNSCDFKTEDAFQLLKDRHIYTTCVHGQN